MNVVTSRFAEYLQFEGVDPTSAHACAETVVSWATASGLVFAAAAWVTSNPSLLLLAAIGAAGGGAVALGAAPACSNVREAATQVLTDRFFDPYRR